MEVVAIVLGVVAQAATWWGVASGVGVWAVVPAVFAGCGVVGALMGDPTPVDNPSLLGAGATLLIDVVAGVMAALVLYGGTIAFAAIAGRWTTFRRHTVLSYQRARSVSLGVALGLSAIAVVGEELFWRGLVQTELTARILSSGEPSAPLAAVATAGLYVLANLPSRSLPIVSAAIVGGLVWALLAVLTGSLVAPALCHLGWTWLMLARPPRAGRGMMGA